MGAGLGPSPATPPAGAVPATSAAQCFEEAWPLSYVRYGVDDPFVRADALPARIRHTPAYLTAEAFVEPIDLAPDGILRLEAEVYRALCWWNQVHPVVLFVHDAATGRWCLEPVSNLTRRFDGSGGRATSRPERRSRFALPAWLIFDGPRPSPARR